MFCLTNYVWSESYRMHHLVPLINSFLPDAWKYSKFWIRIFDWVGDLNQSLFLSSVLHTKTLPLLFYVVWIADQVLKTLNNIYYILSYFCWFVLRVNSYWHLLKLAFAIKKYTRQDVCHARSTSNFLSVVYV